MNWFRNFFIGRYGIDQLNITLLIFSIVLTFLSSVTHFKLLLTISYIPLIYCIFRMFSKNSSARIRENQVFNKYFNPIYSWCKNEIRVIFGTKTHKYFRCPNCKQTVRVPKGVGKVNVICPKCKTKFTKIT
ncbi:hypothetical protein JYG23_10745 [Sedimentibacter sp. zth1]|uniref:hypothetical protein n=1 Tax=Sedimentibacter sp. zth1 TaxID=2816908 RepID=UPI001A939206|nr:hypothetical protein [Sedimentibacter sp. zth1]QSX05158.1 hypothetical protein JYG23_10745 [Sedimentibacter sp. zth1]